MFGYLETQFWPGMSRCGWSSLQSCLLYGVFCDGARLAGGNISITPLPTFSRQNLLGITSIRIYRILI